MKNKITLQQLQAIEYIHRLTYATYYSEDGTREVTVEVCEACDSEPWRTCAAEFPCETLINAQHDYEQNGHLIEGKLLR